MTNPTDPVTLDSLAAKRTCTALGVLVGGRGSATTGWVVREAMMDSGSGQQRWQALHALTARHDISRVRVTGSDRFRCTEAASIRPSGSESMPT